MPQHRNFKCWLLVDGEPRQEFEGTPDPEDERVYTCWVASEVGKARLLSRSRFKPIVLVGRVADHLRPFLTNADVLDPLGELHEGHVRQPRTDLR